MERPTHWPWSRRAIPAWITAATARGQFFAKRLPDTARRAENACAARPLAGLVSYIIHAS